MIYVVPKIVKAILEYGFKKLVQDASYRAAFNESFTVIESTVERFKTEAAAYGIEVENFFEPDTALDTWLQSYAQTIKIGYPRTSKENILIDQITLSYGSDADENDVLGSYGGDILEEPTPGTYRQYYSISQIEAKTLEVHIISENANIVWIVSEAIKYILRSNMRVLESFGIKNMKLNSAGMPPPGTDTGFPMYYKLITISSMSVSQYKVPADIDGDNVAPSDVLISPEIKETTEDGYVTLGEENP